MKIYTDEIHVRNHRITIGWDELRKMFETAIRSALNLEDAGSLDIKLWIEQKREGNPSVSVAKWDVTATITEKLDD